MANQDNDREKNKWTISEGFNNAKNNMKSKFGLLSNSALEGLGESIETINDFKENKEDIKKTKTKSEIIQFYGAIILTIVVIVGMILYKWLK